MSIFFWLGNSMGIPNPILYFTWNDHNSPISCLWTDLNNFFFFYLEIRWRFQIWHCTLPQMTNWTTKIQFLVYEPILLIFFLWLGNSMGILNPILYFTSIDLLDHKIPISCLRNDLNIFFLWLQNSMEILKLSKINPIAVRYFTSND